MYSPVAQDLFKPTLSVPKLAHGSSDGIILPEPKPFIGIHMEDEWHSKPYTTQVAKRVTKITAG